MLDWSVPQYCKSCSEEMRKPKSEFDARPPHYGGGLCQKCYYLSKSSDETRRYDWSKPRYCSTCRRRMRPNGHKSDGGSTVRHHSAGICETCVTKSRRPAPRFVLTYDENGQVCKRCEVYRDFSAFPNSKTSPTKRKSTCTRCVTLIGHYRMTAKQYEDLLGSQGGGCAICGIRPEKTNLHVDHDHSCCPTERTCGTCVRGIICGNCNLTIGQSKESVERLLAIIDYLSR